MASGRSYGCESWISKKSDECRINSFEMKALRHLLRVSWTDRRTNDWVLQKAETKPNLLEAIKKETFFSWTCFKERRKLYGERNIQGTTPGQRRRGRPKMYWHDNIMKRTGLSENRLLRSVEDRTQWRMYVHEAVNHRIEDD